MSDDSWLDLRLDVGLAVTHARTRAVLERPSAPRAAIGSIHVRKKAMSYRVTFSMRGRLNIREIQYCVRRWTGASRAPPWNHAPRNRELAAGGHWGA
jgi:hypothetical protein